jgi:D-arabinose 5-phosphate isomerase GutQ
MKKQIAKADFIVDSKIVVYIPIISSINKNTGQYQLDMDGNINSMLHKIFLNREHISKVYMTIPSTTYVSDSNLEIYKNYVMSLFDNKIKFVFIRSDIYLSSVTETRKMANKYYDKFQINLLKLFNEDSKHLNDMTIICELPFDLQHIEHIERCRIIYNFNWSYVEGYCQNGVLLQSSVIEQNLAKQGYPIALLSEMQYAAFESINQDVANVAVMKKIYSKKFVHLQFDNWIKHYVNDKELELASKYVEDFNNLLLLDKTFIYLFPYRLNDERYQLPSVMSLAEIKATKTNDTVYVYLLNPTGVDLSTILTNVCSHQKVKVVDLSAITAKSSKMSRLLYILFLKTIYLHEQSTGKISLELPHYELDMHLSLAEHITFAKSSTHCSKELYNEITEKYVDDNDDDITEQQTNFRSSEQLLNNVVRFDDVCHHHEKIVELSDLAIQSIVSNLTSFKTTSQILQDVTKLIDLILISNKEDKSIYFTGIGKNQTVAEKTANTFRSLGFPAHSINPISGLHGDMGMLKPNDLVIAISKSGKTSELNDFLNYVKTHKYVNVVSFQQTGLNASTISAKTELAKTSDFVIDLPRVDELETSNTVPTLSTIIMQAYLDIIATICSEKLDYSIKDFRLNHPGGIIGSAK